MEQKLTFTAYLRDEYTKRFDALADKSDADIKKVAKNLDKLSTTGKKAAMSIAEIEKRIQTLGRAKKLTLDTRAIKYAQDEIKKLQLEKDKLEGKTGGSGTFSGMGLGRGFAVAGGLTAAGLMAKQGISAAVQASMEREQQQISFEVLTGSRNKGNKMLGDIVKMGAETPFESNDLIKATQTMLNFGVAQEKVLPVMRQLGDISGGNNDRFQSLALAFGQVSSTGRLMGQDLLQMVNAGFNPLQEISRTTGRSMKLLEKDMEDGKITVDMVTKAFTSATSEGGRYFGMMEKQSQTLAGQWSTLKDNTHELAVVIGDRFMPNLKGSIGLMSSMVATVKKWVEIPTSKKLEDETNHLQLLRVELGLSTTSEERRKAILNELKEIQPDIVDGTKSEKEQLEQLTGALDKYISKRKEQIAFQKVTERYADDIAGYNGAMANNAKSLGMGLNAVTMATQLGLNIDGMSQGNAEIAARKFLKDRIKRGIRTNVINTGITGNSQGVGGIDLSTSAEERALEALDEALTINKESFADIAKYSKGYKEAMAAKANIEKLLGTGDGSGTNTLGAKKVTNGDGNGNGSSKSTADNSMGSISGGSKVTHLNISINNLVGGGVNIHSQDVREGATKMKDVVVEALLTAVNDTNLAANN